MGILWTVWPTTDEMKEWLTSEGVEYPAQVSRLPKGKEIKSVLESLDGYKVEIKENGVGNSWQAWIESTSNPEEYWTLLNITEYSGDDEYQEPWFEKGHEILIKLILSKLSTYCGPLVIIPDTGGTPEVINA